jgi:hypothetical protein
MYQCYKAEKQSIALAAQKKKRPNPSQLKESQKVGQERKERGSNRERRRTKLRKAEPNPQSS